MGGMKQDYEDYLIARDELYEELDRVQRITAVGAFVQKKPLKDKRVPAPTRNLGGRSESCEKRNPNYPSEPYEKRKPNINSEPYPPRNPVGYSESSSLRNPIKWSEPTF